MLFFFSFKKHKIYTYQRNQSNKERDGKLAQKEIYFSNCFFLFFTLIILITEKKHTFLVIDVFHFFIFNTQYLIKILFVNVVILDTKNKRKLFFHICTNSSFFMFLYWFYDLILMGGEVRNNQKWIKVYSIHGKIVVLQIKLKHLTSETNQEMFCGMQCLFSPSQIHCVH